MAQYGQSTQKHDTIDVNDYYARIDERLQHHAGGTIVDAFSGGGRDIIRMYDLLDGEGDFLAIDSEAQKIIDMLAKNADNQLLVDNETCIELAVSQDELDRIFDNHWIAAVQGRFPDAPFGNHAAKSDIDLKADFMLCNAGVMFLRPDELQASLRVIGQIIAPKGELALRFSQARDDKQKELGKSYFIHDPEIVCDVLESEGLLTKRHADVPDPDGRPFSWVDIQAIKP